MDNKKILDAQKAGANARAIGSSFLANPYYQSDRMPAETGESIEDWQRLATAWELGWRLEDLMEQG